MPLVSSPDIKFFARALRPCEARAKNLVAGDETSMRYVICVMQARVWRLNPYAYTPVVQTGFCFDKEFTIRSDAVIIAITILGVILKKLEVDLISCGLVSSMPSWRPTSFYIPYPLKLYYKFNLQFF